MRITANRIKTLTKIFLKYLFWILLILFLLDTYVYFFAESKYLQELFNIASEKTPATWVSSTVLLIISVQFFFLQYFTKEKIWNFAGFFFIYLSLDDAAYVHEQLSSWVSQQSHSISSLPSYGWLYVIAPILAAVLLVLFYKLFYVLRSQNITPKYLTATLSLLATSILFDFIDGYFSNNELSKIQIHYLRISEEIIEIIAFAFLLQTMSLLLQNYLSRNTKHAKKKEIIA